MTIAMTRNARLKAALFLSVVTVILPAAAFAQDPAGMGQPTTGGSLDILLEPEWSDGGQAKFKVTFLDPGTDNIHQHQDYDFVIMQGDKEVFRASKQTGQQVLHNEIGTLTVSYKFEEVGAYTIQVSILGLGFPPIPINPETATFPINVTPEFPAGAIGAVAALMTTAAIVLSRGLRA